MTADPLERWPEPKSSNQFFGDSTAYKATFRAPLSTGTTADFEPLQYMSPLTSNMQAPPALPPTVTRTGASSDETSSFSKYAVAKGSLALKPTMESPSSVVPRTPQSALVSPQAPIAAEPEMVPPSLLAPMAWP